MLKLCLSVHVVIRCLHLNPIANGWVTTNGKALGAKAVYQCDPGFEVVGTKTRTCNSPGVWNGTAPECQRPGKGLVNWMSVSGFSLPMPF